MHVLLHGHVGSFGAGLVLPQAYICSAYIVAYVNASVPPAISNFPNISNIQHHSGFKCTVPESLGGFESRNWKVNISDLAGLK